MARFAEVSEADAAGDIAAIYADIRTSLGAPMVNLVYRHMATIPGCLEWGWGTLRPLFASGLIPEAAATVSGKIALPPVEKAPRAALHDAGIDDQARAAIAAVVASYNRANPMNLIALEVLRLSLADGPAGEITTSAAPTETPVLPTLPAMVDPARVAPDVARLLDRLAHQGTGGTGGAGGAGGVVPSLYRHLAHWPGLLDLMADSTETLFERIDFAASCDRIEARATAAARALPRPDSGLKPPNDAQSDGLMALIGFFPPAICRMIVIGAWLRRALPV